MTTSSVDNSVFAIGKLYKNPTALSSSSLYGTELGLVKDVIHLPARAHARLTAEEFGVETFDYLDLGEANVVTAVLRSPTDDDVLDTIFPGCTTGTVSGKKVRNFPVKGSPPTAADWRAGRLLTERAIVLLFVPEDADRHPALVAYKALPMLQETSELNFSLANPLEYGVVFACVRDASDRVLKQGRLEDLVL